MRFEDIVQEFRYDDLQWLIPVAAGLIIVFLGLLVALFRGMTSSVMVALIFGGLVTMSPVILNGLQRGDDGVGVAAADVARSAAALAELNNDVVVDLSRVVTTMRTALDGLSPLVTGENGDGLSPEVVERFAQSLSDTEERLDAAVASIANSTDLREQLDAHLQQLDVRLLGSSQPR